MSAYHTPVMLDQAIDGLGVAPGKLFIDATLGGGGHATEILLRGGKLLGIDTDNEAIEATQLAIGSVPNLKKSDYLLVRGNFRNIQEIARDHGFEHVDGILFDLGVSSHQLDTPARGFSYRYQDSPLDLRLDQTTGMTAAEYLQRVSAYELNEIITTYGEEERAGRIVHALIRARGVKKITTTGDLLQIIQDEVGKSDAKAVASRVFQALRITVNDEMGALKEALKGSLAILRPHGRLVVISFHSLEDRIVKQFMRSDAWKVITKKPMTATGAQVNENIRARSAKLRIAEKL